jgi:hypothetical protein
VAVGAEASLDDALRELAASALAPAGAVA